MIPPEPQNFGFKFPASGSVPVLFSSMKQIQAKVQFHRKSDLITVVFLVPTFRVRLSVVFQEQKLLVFAS